MRPFSIDVNDAGPTRATPGYGAAMQTLLVDGTVVQVEGSGDPAIVMVHGWPDTLRLWDPQVAAFARTHRCVRFTLPGFEPGSPRHASSMEEVVALLAHVVDAVSPREPVILMVHDWGCTFASQYYAAHPTRVGRLVMVDVGDTRGLPRSWNLLELGMVAAYQLTLAFAWLLPAGVGNPITRGMARLLRAPADPALVHAGMDYPYYLTWSAPRGSFARLRRFEPVCPVFFAYGRRKPLMFHSPDWIETLAQDSRNHVEAFDTGHWVTVAAADRFNAAVAEWLRG